LKTFKITDELLTNVTVWKKKPGYKIFDSKVRFQIELDYLRDEFKSKDLEIEKVQNFYTFVTTALLNQLTSDIKSAQGTSAWR